MTVECRCPRFKIYSVKTTKMCAYPNRITQSIEVNGFQIILRDNLSRIEIPRKTFGTRMIDIQTSSFGANPQITCTVFCHSAYYRIAQSYSFAVRSTIMGEYFICRIKIVDSAEIGSQPQSTLPIFNNTPYTRICQTARQVHCRK